MPVGDTTAGPLSTSIPAIGSRGHSFRSNFALFSVWGRQANLHQPADGFRARVRVRQLADPCVQLSKLVGLQTDADQGPLLSRPLFRVITS
jgi:hypothetical protein